ncbi:MAG TPA: DUF4870 domain-containing protein [Gemmatimonadales bacterium]|jgi:uncharacterized membrane protein|nr:DUF4870 domain-containing protein [Gemmatimonadales bacterium]
MSADASTGTSTGLAANVAGLLSYILGPITGVLFLVLEKENRFVRFHAMQSVVVGVALIALSIALSIASSMLAFVPVIGWIVALLAGLTLAIFSFVLWILLMVRAFRGKEWAVPLAGAFARRFVTPATAATSLR